MLGAGCARGGDRVPGAAGCCELAVPMVERGCRCWTPVWVLAVDVVETRRRCRVLVLGAVSWLCAWWKQGAGCWLCAWWRQGAGAGCWCCLWFYLYKQSSTRGGSSCRGQKGGTPGREKWLELFQESEMRISQQSVFLWLIMSGRDCKKRCDPLNTKTRMQWASFELLGGALFYGEEAC